MAAAVAGAMLPAVAGAEPADPPTVPGTSEPFVDRLIEGGSLPLEATQETEGENNQKGNVRSLTVELSGSHISPRSQISGVSTANTDRAQDEVGISVSGRYQTDNHGVIIVDAQLRRGTDTKLTGNKSSSSTNGSITLSDRDFPLGNGWMADSAVGIVATSNIPILRRQPRFYIPTSPVLGGSVVLKRYDPLTKQSGGADPQPVASLNLSIGEPGLVGGLHLADFSGLSGVSISAGGQVELTPQFDAGFQAIGVENTHDPYSAILQNASLAGAGSGKISSQAALGSASYSAGGFRLQANAIWSHLSGQTANSTAGSGGSVQVGNSRSAAGGWLDASFRTGRSSHSGGVYYFGPDLTWGTSAIVNNAYGAYYRFSSSSQRWRWTFSLDAVNSVNGSSSSGIIINADVRRQLTFKTSAGVNSTVRVANGQTSTQLLGFMDFTNRLGLTRAEAGWSHDPASDLYHLGWNQTWELPVWLPTGSRLGTQLGFDHRRQSEASPYYVDQTLIGNSNSFGAAISAGASPFSDISIDANLAFSTNASASSASVYGPVDSTGGSLGILSSQQGRAFSATLAATARLSSKWSLSASFTDTRSNLLARYGLPVLSSSPLGNTAADLARAQKSTFRLLAGYLTLRYSVSAGLPSGAIGSREFPVGGTGFLAGHVYLDSNANQRREPSEAGVAGIVIILDGLFAIRTDQAGFYRFEGVAEGHHRVTVDADALPLPWSIVSNDVAGLPTDFATTIEVGVRATSTLDIAASR